MADKGLLGSVSGKSGGSGDKSTGKLKPAELQLYKKKKDSKKYDEIPCMFRPSEISISKGVSWSLGKQGEKADGMMPERNVPTRHFCGGEAAKLKLDLFFDTTDTGEDVRGITDKLFTLVTIRQETLDKSPKTPYCRFVWGKIISFMSVVTEVSVKYTLFLPDGTPVRAEASLSLEQALDEAKLSSQNPTSLSDARKLWVVTEGETLDWIAYQEYGDSAQWRHIAQTNDLLNPKDLRAGQLLKLTPLP